MAENEDGERLYWGNRIMESSILDLNELDVLANKPLISVLSYNVLRQSMCMPPRYPNCQKQHLRWLYRRDRLMEEITTYDADIVCLQEVECYEEFWHGGLSKAGMDSVYYENEDGNSVVIAFRDDLFQLTRTDFIDFNKIVDSISDSKVGSVAKQNNIGMMVLLQPWEMSTFPTALCITTAQLASDTRYDELRIQQAKYLCQMVEVFNADFQLPIIMAGSFNATPDSDTYHIITTGRPKPKPMPPSAPQRPESSDVTASSIHLTWQAPTSTDGPITGYKISRRVGGNTAMGYHHEIQIGVDHEHTIRNLSGGMIYEFKVAAKNANGYGKFSLGSFPVSTKRLHDTKEPFTNIISHDEGLEATPRVRFDFKLGDTGRTPRLMDGEIHELGCPRAMDGNDALKTNLGCKDYAHFQSFQSAYRSQEQETAYSYTNSEFSKLFDYIFHSSAEFVSFQTLQLGDLSTYQSIPNETFSSDHLALFTILSCQEDNLRTKWH